MFSNPGAIGLVLAVLVAGAAEARAQQTITYTTQSAGISDGDRDGCVGNDRWLNPEFPAIRFTWSDSTGAVAGKVRVEVSVCWGYFGRPNVNLQCRFNDVLQSPNLQSPGQPTGNCNLALTTSATYEAEITDWNPDGQNEMSLTISQGDVMVFSTTGPFIVEIVVTKLNDAPAPPTQLLQRDANSQSIPL